MSRQDYIFDKIVFKNKPCTRDALSRLSAGAVYTVSQRFNFMKFRSEKKRTSDAL